MSEPSAPNDALGYARHQSPFRNRRAGRTQTASGINSAAARDVRIRYSTVGVLPIGLWFGLEHFVQDAVKLLNRRPRIGRPGREPLLQPTAPEDEEVDAISLIQAAPSTGVSCHTKNCAIALPGAGRVATFSPLASLQKCQNTQADRSHIVSGMSGQVHDSVGL
jgi:hypothetical protein